MEFYKVALLLACVVGITAILPIEVFHIPKPYSFGYAIKDKHGEQHRQEVGDGLHSVRGSYGFKDERGIERQVNYIADKGGFRAEIKTNEPGTAPLNPAAVKMESSAHPYFGMLKGPVAAGAKKGMVAGGFNFPGFLELNVKELEKSDLALGTGLAKEKELNEEALIAELAKESKAFEFESGIEKFAEGGFPFLSKMPEDAVKEVETDKGFEELIKQGFALLPIDVKAVTEAEREKDGLALAKILNAEKFSKLGLGNSPLFSKENIELGLKESELMKGGLSIGKLNEAFPFAPMYTKAPLPVSSPFFPKPKGFVYGGQYLGGMVKGYDARFFR